MAGPDHADETARPPESPPPGTPTFEAPPPFGSRPDLPPAPPPAGPGWGIAPNAIGGDALPSGRRGSMTRGWAWTALVLLVCIPLGGALAVAVAVIDEAAYDPEVDSQEDGWVWLLVFVAFVLWAGACAVGAAISAVIGTVRSRRHPELRQAPAVAVLVWVGLGLLAVPVAVSIVSAAVL